MAVITLQVNPHGSDCVSIQLALQLSAKAALTIQGGKVIPEY